MTEATDYLRSLSPGKNYALQIVKAKKEGRTLVQPRGGVAMVEDQIALLHCLQDQGADLLPNTTDTYTRNLKFQEAQRGIEESQRAGRSMLNGCPIVNHGLQAVRRISESVRRPIIVLSGTDLPPDHRRDGVCGEVLPLFLAPRFPTPQLTPKTFPLSRESKIISTWIDWSLSTRRGGFAFIGSSLAFSTGPDPPGDWNCRGSPGNAHGGGSGSEAL